MEVLLLQVVAQGQLPVRHCGTISTCYPMFPHARLHMSCNNCHTALCLFLLCMLSCPDAGVTLYQCQQQNHSLLRAGLWPTQYLYLAMRC